jgi:hypothetical protein
MSVFWMDQAIARLTRSAGLSYGSLDDLFIAPQAFDEERAIQTGSWNFQRPFACGLLIPKVITIRPGTFGKSF